MKNFLVFLVTIGMGYAYWYQRPEATPAASASPTAATAGAPASRPAFNAARTALDDPATPVGTRPRQASVLLGSDKLDAAAAPVGARSRQGSVLLGNDAN